MSTAFGAYRRHLAMVRKDDSGRDCIDFHSFRRSATRCLDNVRVARFPGKLGSHHIVRLGGAFLYTRLAAPLSC